MSSTWHAQLSAPQNGYGSTARQQQQVCEGEMNVCHPGGMGSGPPGCWDPWSSSMAHGYTDCIAGSPSKDAPFRKAEVIVSQSLHQDRQSLNFNRSRSDASKSHLDEALRARRIQQQNDSEYPESRSIMRPSRREAPSRSSGAMERGPGAAFRSRDLTKPREEDCCAGTEFRSCEFEICGDMEDDDRRRSTEIRIGGTMRHF